jgi:hypothetical protein
MENTKKAINLINLYNAKGYKHFTENTIEELDELSLKTSDIITEFAHLREWLRINHGIWVSVDWMSRVKPYESGYYCHLRGITKKLNQDNFIVINDTLNPGYEVFNSPQEAYSAAFDYVLKELI